MEKNEIIPLKITGLTSEGSGIARYDGKAVFVPFSAVGDEIEAIVYSGTKININYFIDEVIDDDHQEDIFEYFKEADSDSLSAAIKELGNDYSEEEIRLMRIKFLSELGN